MKKAFSFICVGLMALSCTGERAGDLINQDFAFAGQQLRYALTETENVRNSLGKTPEELPSPRNIQSDGSLRLVRARDWCSGFFPGELWYMYEYTKDDFWKKKAEFQTELLEPLKSYKGTHDLGFMLYCSYGNGYRMGQSDNMMNLEFLFWATKASGDSTFYKIAVTHADNTMKYHFRKDYSSYHVIDYDTITGNVRNKHTHQGYAHESAWARGQAWGLYGYTMCYRETGDRRYLNQAEQIASFIFHHPNLPSDLIPYWDYNDPEIPASPRDVSAATITASALYELSAYSDKGGQYKKWADTIMENLTESYRVPLNQMHGFLLRLSTGHKPAGTEIDVPIVYADYYFLEALLRKKNLEE